MAQETGSQDADADAANASGQAQAQEEPPEQLMGESLEQFEGRLKEELGKRAEQFGGDDEVMKEIEAFVIEKSIREYEKRLKTIIKEKETPFRYWLKKASWTQRNWQEKDTSWIHWR